ncbi:hypothetical protein F4677DRAFT_426106 [Hypoxylon crocopeplum]|nr:hypothetical protein F4677DRAFT_426106 [Hypoxylon crocopeplum]
MFLRPLIRSAWATYLPSCSRTAYRAISRTFVPMHIASTRRSTSPANVAKGRPSTQELHRIRSSVSLPHLSNRHHSRVCKRHKSLTRVFPLRPRVQSKPHNQGNQQDKPSETASKIDTSHKAEWHQSSISNNVKATPIPGHDVQGHEKSWPECIIKVDSSNGASSYRDVHDDLWHTDIRTDVEDQRLSYQSLNPGSEYQANLDAVSPDCRDLFLRCCPTAADKPDMEAEDDSVDLYWTWSREKEQWFHVDEERNTVVWFPEDFD